MSEKWKMPPTAKVTVDGRRRIRVCREEPAGAHNTLTLCGGIVAAPTTAHTYVHTFDRHATATGAIVLQVVKRSAYCTLLPLCCVLKCLVLCCYAVNNMECVCVCDRGK